MVAVEPSGSSIVLSSSNPSTTLSLMALGDDDVCTGVKRHTLSFSDSSNSPYTAVDAGMGTVTISVTDGM